MDLLFLINTECRAKCEQKRKWKSLRIKISQPFSRQDLVSFRKIWLVIFFPMTVGAKFDHIY